MKRSPLLLAAVIAVACATTPQTGIISARWTAHQQQMAPVTLSWESESTSHGRMFTTLGAGGEHFRGGYVRVTAQTKVEVVQPIIGGWGPVWTSFDWGRPVDPWWWGPDSAASEAYGTAYYSGFVTRYTGSVVASLYGDRTHSMRCRFTLNEPQQGLVGGGVGECQTSDGGVIDANF